MKIRQIDIKGERYDVEAFINPIPTGAVFPFAGITAPEGFLLCDGSEVSRVTYAKLFGVIGEIYGKGDGSTTFNLPNSVDRYIEGTKNEVGQTVEAGLPNIVGNLGVVQMADNTTQDGALSFIRTRGYNWSSSYSSIWYSGLQKLDASKSNPIYGKSDTVQPPAIKMQYIIKY